MRRRKAFPLEFHILWPLAADEKRMRPDWLFTVKLSGPFRRLGLQALQAVVPIGSMGQAMALISVLSDCWLLAYPAPLSSRSSTIEMAGLAPNNGLLFTPCIGFC